MSPNVYDVRCHFGHAIRIVEGTRLGILFEASHTEPEKRSLVIENMDCPLCLKALRLQFERDVQACWSRGCSLGAKDCPCVFMQALQKLLPARR